MCPNIYMSKQRPFDRGDSSRFSLCSCTSMYFFLSLTFSVCTVRAELSESQLESSFSLTVDGQEESMGESAILEGNLSFDANNATFSVGDNGEIQGTVNVGAGVTGAKLLFLGSTTLAGTQGDDFEIIKLNAESDNKVVRLEGNINSQRVEVGSESLATQLSLEGISHFSGDLVLTNSVTQLDLGDYTSRVDGLFDLGGAKITSVIHTNPANNYRISADSGLLRTDQLLMGETQGERMEFTYTNSLSHGSTHRLVEANQVIDAELDGYSPFYQDESGGRIQDNSYILDSTVEEDEQGLLLTVSRVGGLDVNNTYIEKSRTAGDLSNSAAWTLGDIAARGLQKGDLGDVITQFELDDFGLVYDEASLAEQVKLLAPVANRANVRAGLAVSNYIANALQRHNSSFGSAPAVSFSNNEKVNLWADPFVVFGQQNGHDSFYGYSHQSIGGQFGLDTEIGESTRAGIILSHAVSEVQHKETRKEDFSELSLSSAYGFLSHQMDGWSFNGYVSSGQGDISQQRLTAYNRKALLERAVETQGLGLSVSHEHRLRDGQSSLRPTFGIRRVRWSQDQATETGGGDLSLAYNKEALNVDSVHAELAFSRRSRIFSKSTEADVYVGVARETGLNGTEIDVSYTGETDPAITAFSTPTSNSPAMALYLGSRLSTVLKNNVRFDSTLAFEHRTRFQQLSLNATFKWSF